MLRTRLRILVVILLAAFPAYAQTSAPSSPPASPEGVTLASLISESLAHNPSLAVARYRWEAAKAKTRLLFTLPDPWIEYEYDKILVDNDMLMRGKTAPMRPFSVSQEFSFPYKYVLRREAARQEAAARERAYQEAERKVVQQVKSGYVALFLVQKKRALVAQQLDLLQQMVKSLQAQVASNQRGQADALRVQLEYAKLSNEGVLLEKEEKIAQARLRSLSGRQDNAVFTAERVTLPSETQLSEASVADAAKQNRAELLSMKDLVRKAQIEHTLSKQEYAPDFMVKYSRLERDNRPASGAWSAAVGVTVPIWFWDKQRSMVRETSAALKEMEAQYREAENMAVFEARSAYAEYTAARDLAVSFAANLVPQARAQFEAGRRGYEAGTVMFQDLLESLSMVRELEMEQYEAEADAHVALADLERLTGTPLIK
jgi:outer membrane protein, heavy metal efflux system